MPSSHSLRLQIESTLQDRIPAALSPRPAGLRESISCGISTLDALAAGGFPVGALAELVGPECCGRTTAALSFIAQVTAQGGACAWIDVADALDPESAAANGVDLTRLLWVRCAGETALTQTPAWSIGQNTSAPAPGKGTLSPACGGGSPHPRFEGRGMPEAIEHLLTSQPRSSAVKPARRQVKIGTPSAPNRPLIQSNKAAEREEQVPTDRVPPRRGHALQKPARRPSLDVATVAKQQVAPPRHASKKDKWQPLDRALRSADLLLQAGGFRAIVLDLGSTPAEQAWRIPMATWFRFRAACERARVSFLLLTQHPCARSSAELVMRMQPGTLTHRGPVMTGVAYRSELDRQRQHRPESNVIPMRKPPRSEHEGAWSTQSAWVRAQ